MAEGLWRVSVGVWFCLGGGKEGARNADLELRLAGVADSDFAAETTSLRHGGKLEGGGGRF